MLVNGDKLVVTKGIDGVLEDGEIVEVIDVNENGMISFAFGEGYVHKGLMTAKECEEHFEKYEEPKELVPTVSEERIEWIINNSEFEVATIFDKCTVVICKLPNGFVITESSSCVSPENYDEEVGVNICMDRIIDKIYELEAYRIQEEMCDAVCEYRESDECIDTDLDCDDCEHRDECWCNDDEREESDDDCDDWCE